MLQGNQGNVRSSPILEVQSKLIDFPFTFPNYCDGTQTEAAEELCSWGGVVN